MTDPIFYPPSDVPYRRRRKTPSSRQPGGTGNISTTAVFSGTGQKSATSTSTISFAGTFLGTGVKSTSGTRSVTLVSVQSGTGLKSASATNTMILLLEIDGLTPPAIPFLEKIEPKIYTSFRKPPYRFIAQHARTGQFLSWELPVLEPTIKLTLSGPTVITGKFKPEAQTLKDEYGQPALKSWGTLIHFEMDGQIRASGILMPSEFSGPEWNMEAQGFATYPHEMPYWGAWPDALKYNVDPIDVIQEIWRYLQSFPNGNLGVIIPRTVGPLPVRLGAELDGENKVKPYSIDWWDAKNCGSEIDSMAKLAPLDYVEAVRWKPQRVGVEYKLVLGYPRVGAVRTDLRFVQGENIISVVPIIEPDNFYASGVAGIGAGEGALAVRDLVEINDPSRLRRIYTYQSKKITSQQQLNSILRDELTGRLLDREIQQITVSSTHPNARFGSYQVGDDILPQADIRWWGWTRIWHRIIGITYSPGKDSVLVDLKRSSSFRYGQEAPST